MQFHTNRIVLTGCCAALVLAASQTYAASLIFNDGNSIKSANIDGTGLATIIAGIPQPYGLTFDGVDTVYFTDLTTDKIQRVNQNGSGLTDLVTSGLSDPRSVALDTANGHLYWLDRFTDKIQRANLDGTSVTDLITTGLSQPHALALDLAAGRMYWTDFGTGAVHRANLDGTGVTTIAGSLSGPHGLAIDPANGKIYFTQIGTGRISRVNYDGTGLTDLVTGLSTPVGLALFGGKMYWTDDGTKKIQSAMLDGSGVTDLITTGLSGLTNIVVVPELSSSLLAMLGALGVAIGFHARPIRNRKQQ